MTLIEIQVIMTVREVSEYLRITQSTVYHLAQEGRLPGRKIGGMWRFSRLDIDAWLRNPPTLKESRPDGITEQGGL